MLRGRAKGEHERIVVLAHQIEAMAREKLLKGVKHYLEPASVGKAADQGARDVLAMMRAMKKKQDGG